MVIVMVIVIVIVMVIYTFDTITTALIHVDFFTFQPHSYGG